MEFPRPANPWTLRLEAPQLALGDLDLEAIQKIAHFLVGDFTFGGDFHGHCAGELSFFGRLADPGNDLFFFHDFLPRRLVRQRLQKYIIDPEQAKQKNQDPLYRRADAFDFLDPSPLR